MSDNGDLHTVSISQSTGFGGRGENASLSDRVRSLRLADSVAAHSATNNRLPWALCFLMALLAGGLGYYALNKPAPVADAMEADNAKPSAPPTSPASPSSIASSGPVALENKGYVIPVHQIQVSPKVSGMIVKLTFEEGMRVKRGDILAELEDTDYRAERDRAKAALEAARQQYLELKNGSRPEEIEASHAELAEAEANRDQLYLDWKRNTVLKNGTAVAERDYELAYAGYKAMQAKVARLRQNYILMKEGPRIERVKNAEANLKAAEDALAKAQWYLDNCTIRAPLSGTILTKFAEEGNIVNQLSFNLKGSLCDMADLSDLEIDLTIQERDVSKLYKGQKCRVKSEAYPDRVYDGVVSRLMPIADRGKGSLPVRVKVTVPKDEEGVYLKPNMGAIVSFLSDKKAGERRDREGH